MTQYHSGREQEEEDDMEQMHHWEEAARCVKTLSKLWKKSAWTAKLLGERSLMFGVLIHYWSNIWCDHLTVSACVWVRLLQVFNILYWTAKLVFPTVNTETVFKIFFYRTIVILRPDWVLAFFLSYPLTVKCTLVLKLHKGTL